MIDQTDKTVKGQNGQIGDRSRPRPPLRAHMRPRAPGTCPDARRWHPDARRRNRCAPARGSAWGFFRKSEGVWRTCRGIARAQVRAPVSRCAHATRGFPCDRARDRDWLFGVQTGNRACVKAHSPPHAVARSLACVRDMEFSAWGCAIRAYHAPAMRARARGVDRWARSCVSMGVPMRPHMRPPCAPARAPTRAPMRNPSCPYARAPTRAFLRASKSLCLLPSGPT